MSSHSIVTLTWYCDLCYERFESQRAAELHSKAKHEDLADVIAWKERVCLPERI